MTILTMEEGGVEWAEAQRVQLNRMGIESCLVNHEESGPDWLVG